MPNTAFRLSVLAALHWVMVLTTPASATAISPNQIVERDFRVYEVGSSTPFTGTVVSTRYDGSVYYEENYVDGTLHGLRTEWDREGNKISETTYEKGSKTGPETFWYSNGQVMAVTPFLNGGFHGQLTRWCRNGQKRYEWSYSNNVKDGPYLKWYANGQKHLEYVYSDDQLHGMQTQWYASGQKEFEGVFAHGIKHGAHTGWHENGQKRFDGIYSDGRRGDRFTRWYEDGQLHTDYEVDATGEESTTTIWFASGQKQCETIFSKAIGEPLARTAWDESGNLLTIEGDDYLDYCKSSLSTFTNALTHRPGETNVYVRTQRSADGTRTTTRYAKVGDETTEREVELTASEIERRASRIKDQQECGLRTPFL